MSLRQHKLARLVVALLSEGMTPHKIALTLALGMMLGATPVLGTTTILCAAAAVLLRLNLPLIQAVNFVAYPLQLLLLIPFMQAGQWLFHQPPLPFNRSQLLALLHTGAWNALRQLWLYSLHGVAAWLLLGGASAALIYLILRPLLGYALARRTAGHKPAVNGP